MGLIRLRARAQWRGHVWGFVALALAIGFVGSVVLTAVSGARRTRTSVTRLAASTRAFDTFIAFADGQSNAATSIAGLPEVEAADRFSPMSFFTELGQLPLIASIDGHAGTTVQRDRVLRGRRPHSNAALEVDLAEPVARRLHLDVGGELPLTGISAQQTACLFGQSPQGEPRCAEIQQAFYGSPPDFSKFAGPRVTLRVVGVTRGLGDVAARPDDVGTVTLTSAFYRAYHDDVAVQTGLAVRLRAGVTTQEFQAAVARVVPPAAIRDATDNGTVIDGLQSTVGVLANGLAAFAAIVALAGFAAVALAFSRRATDRSTERTALRSLGMTRGELAVDSFAPLVPIALAGGLLATVGGWLGSTLMPIGTAGRVEPHPGLRFDPLAHAAGGALLAAAIVMLAAFAGLWAARRSEERATTTRVTRVWPLSGVTATIGAHLAFDKVRRSRGVPLRSAVSGAALGVAGILAVTTFGAGLTRLDHTPYRYGWGWDVTISGERATDPEAPEPPPNPTSQYWERRAERIAADADVVGLAHVWFGFQTRVAGRTVTTFAQRGYRGHTGFVIVAGRAPAGAREVALGAKTMRRGHLRLGERVRVADRTMRIVGQAIFPVTDDGYALADGALLSAEAFGSLGLGPASGLGNNASSAYAVQLRHGANRAAATARLTALNKDETPTKIRQPAEVDQLEQLNRLPIVLAAFLVLIALLALWHVIMLSVRHHRPDFAVLRAIGLTPAQTSRTVAWQATMLGAWGALIGVPVGLVVGRLVWAAIARSYGIADDTAWPWIAIALVLPAAVVLANALAWWPGRRAAHLQPAQILRSE